MDYIGHYCAAVFFVFLTGAQFMISVHGFNIPCSVLYTMWSDTLYRQKILIVKKQFSSTLDTIFSIFIWTLGHYIILSSYFYKKTLQENPIRGLKTTRGFKNRKSYQRSNQRLQNYKGSTSFPRSYGGAQIKPIYIGFS